MAKMHQQLTMGILAVLSACTSPGLSGEEDSSSTSRLESFASLMEGAYATAPDDPENNFTDRRVRITSPSLEGVWLYYQLNTGAERKLYRQRVISLTLASDGESIIQKTYGLQDADNYINAWEKPNLLRAMTRNDISLYFDEGCEQVWREVAAQSWQGYVDPENCKIFSERRQAEISIEAEARLTSTNYYQTERGFDADGNKIFGSEPGGFIKLFRQ